MKNTVNRSDLHRRIRSKIRTKPKIEVPDKWYLRKHGLDTDAIEWEFRSLRITLRDAFIDIGNSAIRLKNLFDLSSQTSRRKLKAEHYFIISEFKDDPKKWPYRISKSDIIREIKKLDVRFEKAAGGQLICKAPLIKVLRHFNDLLISMAKKQKENDGFLYKSSSSRARLIAQWTNWFFKAKYGIESTYKPEQIRKLIKAK